MGWIDAWWRTLGRSSGWQLSIVVAYDNGAPVLLWPLVQRRNGFWRIASWMAADTGQYGNILSIRDGDCDFWIKATWQYIVDHSGFDIITLPGVHADSCLGRLLQQEGIPAQTTHFAPVFDITMLEDPKQWELSQKRGFRKDLRRRRRRLAELGEVRFERLRDIEEIENAIPIALQHKKAWFRARKLYGRIIEHPQAAEWMTRAAIDALTEDRLVYAVLKLDGRIIASQLGFTRDRQLYNYFGSFDLDLQRYSPGNILTQDLLQWAIDNGMEQFDLMPPNDDYKACWANTEVKVSSYRLGITPKGRIVNACYNPALQSLGLRGYRALPRGLRKIVARWIGC